MSCNDEGLSFGRLWLMLVGDLLGFVEPSCV